MLRRVSLVPFLARRSFRYGRCTAHIKKPLPFVPPEGASVLVPDFEHYYTVDYDYRIKSLNFIATDASIFTLVHCSISGGKMYKNTAFFAETFKTLAKVVDSHNVCSFLEAVNIELLV